MQREPQRKRAREEREKKRDAYSERATAELKLEHCNHLPISSSTRMRPPLGRTDWREDCKFAMVPCYPPPSQRNSAPAKLGARIVHDVNSTGSRDGPMVGIRSVTSRLAPPRDLVGRGRERHGARKQGVAKISEDLS
jgi:hypothetical protein